MKLAALFRMKPLAVIVGVAILAPPIRWYVVYGHTSSVVSRVSVGNRRVLVRKAGELTLPPVPGSSVGFDCNNPVFRDGDTLYCFSSHEYPFRSNGPDLHHLQNPPTRVFIDNQAEWKQGGRWIESVYKVPGGPLYMWYHNEPPGVVPTRSDRTAPRIGQMVSDDDGLSWRDQGIILDAAPETFSTETANRYFGGGHGDFTVVPDRDGDYFYILFSIYSRDVGEQGVAIARLAAAELEDPVGKADKWFQGRWSEPGLGGHATPVFGVESDWHGADARALWGPSIHWNEYLKEYVVLMNRAAGGDFAQSGVFIAFNARLDDPQAWTRPQKLIDATEWYPQVVGSEPDGESDRVAGRVSRLFLKGRSSWMLEFDLP